MKKFLAILALALPAIAAPIVTYTTSGQFLPGGTDTISVGGGTAQYISGGGSYDLANINPSNVTLGSINTLGFPSVQSLAGYTFVLTINQTSPTIGTGSVTGTLSGNVVVDASNAFLNFATPTLNLGPVTYTIFQSPRGIAIVPPSAVGGGTIAGGTTTIQGQVTAPVGPNDTGTPEPATLGLMGVGLVAVAFAGRRYRAQ